jgi:hypothetical protein
MRWRDDSQVATAAGLVAGESAVVVRAWERSGAGGFTDGFGQRDQVVRRGRGRGEIAVVAYEFPASGGGEAARVGFAEVVRVRLGEGGERADDGGRFVVDVGQGGDRLSGTAVPGAAPWGPHGGTLSLRRAGCAGCARDTPTSDASRFGHGGTTRRLAWANSRRNAGAFPAGTRAHSRPERGRFRGRNRGRIRGGNADVAGWSRGRQQADYAG